MRRFLLALTLALMSAAPVAARQKHTRVARRTDFRNFTFRSGDDVIRVRRGHGTYKTTDGVEFTYTVERVQAAYGDLTGDGREEAAVVLHFDGGGTGAFSKGFIFDGRTSRLILLTTFEGGDRADGGIREVTIKGGVLTVRRNEPERMNGVAIGLCCPVYVLTTRYRWDGRRLVQVGEAQKVEAEPET
jgi:hypothetical protein